MKQDSLFLGTQETLVIPIGVSLLAILNIQTRRVSSSGVAETQWNH